MIYYNLNKDDLYEHAKNLHLTNNTNAIVAYSGKYTGRCPQDKRIVLHKETEDIWWGEVNKPIDEILFYYYYIQGHNYLNETDNEVYVNDYYAGWDKSNEIKVRVYCTDPYHALFMNNMLVKSDKVHDKVDLEIVNCSDLNLKHYDNDLKNLNIDKGDLDENLIGLDLVTGKVVIYGTKYAGEMKKAVLTYMMYKMPINNKLTLHSSACLNKYNEVIAFFGLSGTGKTTLSATDGLMLIGDDEHVWTEEGIYNIEGGCYAKCLNLSEEKEPDIYNAIKKGAILENVILNIDNSVNYNSNVITCNTRCSYPLDHLSKVIIPASVKKHPKNIIMLVCDAFGLFPIVSKLTIKQAVFYFLLGYTCKMPGTESGIDEPKETFSTCFAEPFIIWKPELYGNMLMDKLKEHGSNIWLLNTGWLRNKERMPLNYSREIVNLISDNKLIEGNFINYDKLNVKVPESIEGIPEKYLMPYNCWDNKENYDKRLSELIVNFDKVFIEKFGFNLFSELKN